MLPVFGRPLDGPTPCAVTGARGRRNISLERQQLSCNCVERYICLLGNPDSVEQNCELSGYGHVTDFSDVSMKQVPKPHRKEKGAVVLARLAVIVYGVA